MSQQKKKCRKYRDEYLKFGFVPSPGNMHMPMCLICEKVFLNESMKPSRRPRIENVLASASGIGGCDGLRASYNISLLIVKPGKPHTIGEELLLQVKIPLSNDTVQRRIDDMANDVEETLCNFLKTTQFSLQLDESTLPGNEALLLAYVRFIKAEKLVQEMLIARELEKQIPLTNIISVATDGAPSMIGSQRGLIALLKQVVIDVAAVHCVIHTEHLVAKRLGDRLNSSLQLFRKLCEETDAEYNRLLLHTEVRWLSKGACLTRFSCRFDAVLNFFANHDNTLHVKFKKPRREFHQFPNLCAMKEKAEIQDDVVEAYCQHLDMLYQDFSVHYEDIFGMEVPSWIIDRFADLDDAELRLQEEVMELQTNDELKVKFKNGYQDFRMQRRIAVISQSMERREQHSRRPVDEEKKPTADSYTRRSAIAAHKYEAKCFQATLMSRKLKFNCIRPSTLLKSDGLEMSTSRLN
uniref:DUF4371 domain-containing protein n=1 Tax=Trichuris muris TaxID=70415 RepID=A0A5S6QAD2_TRIMR